MSKSIVSYYDLIKASCICAYESLHGPSISRIKVLFLLRLLFDASGIFGPLERVVFSRKAGSSLAWRLPSWVASHSRNFNLGSSRVSCFSSFNLSGLLDLKFVSDSAVEGSLLR